MAQDFQQFDQRLGKRTFQSKNIGVSVPVAGLTTLIELLNVADLIRFFFSVDVTVNSFDAFEIQGKFHRDGVYVPIYNTSGAFISPVGLLVGASGDLTAQGAGTTGWFVMEVRGLYAVRVQASATVGAATTSSFVCGG